MDLIIYKSSGVKGRVEVPGDKSISHRAAMLLPISKGRGVVKNFLLSEDCVRTINAMRMMGADITLENGNLIVEGRGKEGLKAPRSAVYLGNSGTSMRLLSGIFSGIDGLTFIYGDDSLNRRPMDRIITPLSLMGADIKSLNGEGRAPLVINGRHMKGIDYKMTVKSAQVKSSILIGSLFAEGSTSIIEKTETRDHTERMINYFSGEVIKKDGKIDIKCGQQLEARDIKIPGDISSAAFIIAAAILTPGSEIIINNLSLNRTRTGIIEVLKEMGANLEILESWESNNETFGDVRIRSCQLKAVRIGGDIIPRLIDEIPVIAVLAAFAEGTTVIENAEELKYKESNRIEAIVYNLQQAGVEALKTNDGIIINGRGLLGSEKIIFDSFCDHRIAMAFSLIGFVKGNVKVLNCDSIGTSFPQFIEIMNKIGGNIKYNN
jgi:3-phosphoshikimate 1-carboxyvinyltransferase